MSNRTIFRSLILIVLFAFPLLCFAEYKVVVKKNGKIIEGKLVAEDETSVTIISAGARLQYRKDTLDLERMKQLNADYLSKDDVRTMDRPKPESDTKPPVESSALADVAKQNRNAQTTPQSSSSDPTEQAFEAWISALQEKDQVTASQETQIELSKAKKAQSHYRSKGSKHLSSNDERLMLEQLVKALDARYRKQLEEGAPDDKVAATKKKMEDAKKQLEKLQ